jgi:hypothetical protein
MRAPVRAFVAHRTPTRIRIKLLKPVRPQQELLRLKQRFRGRPDVIAVAQNPLTGSLIIECRKGFELSAEDRRQLGLDRMPRTRVRSNHLHAAGTVSDRDGGSPGALMLAHLLRLVVGVSTRQIGAQIADVMIDIFVRAATSEALSYRRIT